MIGVVVLAAEIIIERTDAGAPLDHDAIKALTTELADIDGAADDAAAWWELRPR